MDLSKINKKKKKRLNDFLQHYCYNVIIMALPHYIEVGWLIVGEYFGGVSITLFFTLGLCSNRKQLIVRNVKKCKNWKNEKIVRNSIMSQT